jgi:hypothetical protein
MKRLITSLQAMLAVTGTWLVMAAPARADFIISGGTAAVTPGGTGTVNFLISFQPSQASNGNDNNLSSFGLVLQIDVQNGNAISDLTFTLTQPDFTTQPNYVFPGGNSAFGPAYWNPPDNTTDPTHPTIAGGDFTNDGSNVTIPSSPPPLLLATVQFSLNPGTPTNSSYTIPIVLGIGTYFNDNTGNNGESIPFSSTPALVTVLSSQPLAAPTPSSLVLAAFGSLGGLLCFWRKRKQAPTHWCEAV